MKRRLNIINSNRRARFVASCIALFCLAHPALPEEFDASSATLEELVLHAQRYGATPAKKETRKKASRELYERGAESLRYLMDNIHIKNSALFMFAHKLVRDHLSDQDAAMVLLDYLDATKELTRKRAAYLLGFCETPEHAHRIMPLLDDEEAAGAAVRTLGKWRVNAAAARIGGFLHHDKEGRRVLASNALRDIGDDRHAPDLIAALNDPAFTVRKVSARALTEIGGETEDALLDELPESRGLAQREIIRILGRLKSKRAVRPLRAMLKEPGLHQDAADALVQINPARADKWLRDAEPTGLAR